MSRINVFALVCGFALIAEVQSAENQIQICTLNPGQQRVTTFLDSKLKREGNAINEEDGYIFKSEKKIKAQKTEVLVGKLVRSDGSIAEPKSFAFASEWTCVAATAENAPKDSLPEVARKIFNKKWSLSDLPCNLNGGTYTIYTNQPPTGATEYLAGKKNQSEQRQDFEFRTSNTEKNVLFRIHTIYADGNKFVMQQVGDPNTVVSEVVEKITLQSDQKILITRELKQIDFDQMMAGRVAYTTKTENTFKNLCK